MPARLKFLIGIPRIDVTTITKGVALNDKESVVLALEKGSDSSGMPLNLVVIFQLGTGLAEEKIIRFYMDKFIHGTDPLTLSIELYREGYPFFTSVKAEEVPLIHYMALASNIEGLNIAPVGTNRVEYTLEITFVGGGKILHRITEDKIILVAES